MKIVYLVHQFYPEHYTGTEKVVLHLATMMQKCGHTVKVFTYSFYEASSYDRKIGNVLYKEFIYKGIPVLAFRHENAPADLGHVIDPDPLRGLARELIKREKPDVAHIVHCMRQAEFVSALLTLQIPYVVTLTDYFLLCPKVNLITSENSLCEGPEKGERCARSCSELPVDHIARRLERTEQILSNAGLVVSPSRFLAELFRREFENLDVRVIPHGLKYEELKINGQRNGIDRGLTFCYAGSLNPHKGVHILIEAFQGLRAESASLKIYGSGPDPTYIESLMAMAAGDKRIEFRGVFGEDQVAGILSNVDVVVIPSLWYENCPFTLAEALACQVPVMAADVGGIGEKLEDGVNGFLFRMGDSSQLRDLMRAAVDDPTVLDSLRDGMNGAAIPTIEEEAYAYERAYRLIREADSRLTAESKM